MLPPSEDDAALIRASLGGELSAFTLLVRRHQGAIRSWFAVRLADSNEAEDLAQEAFLTAFHKLPEFDSGRSFGAWLHGIALNLLRNHQRKFRPFPIGGDAELQLHLDRQMARELESANEGTRLSALRDCLEALDPATRELIQSRYGEGHSIRDLMERSGLNHSTMTMQLHRLRTALAACVEGKLTQTPEA